jgi:predicted alpha/beta hydrolase
MSDKKPDILSVNIKMDECFAWGLFAALLSFILLPLWLSWWSGWYSVVVWLVCCLVAMRVGEWQDRRARRLFGVGPMRHPEETDAEFIERIERDRP